jgi:T5SS/PEP-CTERM-associated repeat protein
MPQDFFGLPFGDRSQQRIRRVSHRCHHRILQLAQPLALLALLGFSNGSSAQLFYSWNNAAGGDYGTAVNWFPGAGAPPDANDGADFALAATYTVESFSDFAVSDVFVSAGNVSWDLGQGVEFHHTYTAGLIEVISGAQLTFFDGKVTADTVSIANGGKVHVLGADQNDAAHITVTGAGSSLTHDNFLEVADYRPETLTIENGGTVISGTGAVGADPYFDSEGVVTVTGAGSTWSTGFNFLKVGDTSPGTLNITNGGTVSDRGGNVGFSGNGTVNVSGAGSKWTNMLDVYVSRDHAGMLNITAGGLVSDVNGRVGSGTGAAGNVHVSGAGAKWANSGQLLMGDTGEATGSLTIDSGGSVTSADGMIGNEGVFSTFAAAVGTVDVTGAGSTWANSATLSVGRDGIGTLNIKNSGAVSNTTGYVAYGTDSKGDVTVSGSGSTWTNTGNLEVGRQGNGTLTINQGGKVTNVLGHVGGTNFSQPGVGNGAVTVSGTGSTWTSDINVDIGYLGTGTLTIENGGNVTNANGFLATFVGSTGTATVTGSGSTWTNTDSINIGNLGKGTLTIESGGSVTNTDGHIGPSAGSTGTVFVRGAGSTWNMTGDLFLGAQGTGSLTVENGGQVRSLSGNIARAGGTPYGTGSVTVTGAGSKWTNTNELRVGNNGVGTLNIANGGSVANSDAYIATMPGSKGTVTIGGAGATWTINGILNVAGDLNNSTNGGAGSLDINSGATVYVQDTVIFPNGTVRLQGGTLDTSTVSFQSTGGQFKWTAGTLHVGIFQGNLTNQGGTLSPGHSAGLTTVVGSYTQQTAGKLDIEIGGPSALDNDLISVSGIASIAGQLQLSMLNNFVPGANQTIPIMQAANLTGTFNNVANGQRLATSDFLGSFRVNYGVGSTFNPNQIVLSNFISTPLAGDYNQNGTVDAADYAVWRKFVGTTQVLPNDPLGGTIGAPQYDVWRANFGKTLGQGAADLASIPEPATVALVAMGVLGLFPRRAKRSRRFSANGDE